MSFDWKGLLRDNLDRIVQCAKKMSSDGDVICVIADTEEARNVKGTGGLMSLVVETKMLNAIPMIDRVDGRKIFCLPISKSKLLKILEPYETTEHLQQLNTGYNLALWAVCFDEEDRLCYDVHAVTPELN